MALVEKNAALMVKDSEAQEKMIALFKELYQDEQKCAELSRNMSQFALPQAIDAIVDNILAL